MPEEPDPVALQAGFGLAVYALLAPTIKLLLDKGMVTEDEIRGVLDHALKILKFQSAAEGAPEVHRWAISYLDSTVTGLQMKGLFQSPKEKPQGPDQPNTL